MKDYALLMQVFNSTDGKGISYTANTAGELREAIAKSNEHKAGPCLIECSIHQDDCSKELITWGVSTKSLVVPNFLAPALVQANN